MVKALVIIVVAVAGLFCLDWFVIGAGPVTALAKSRCVSALDGRKVPTGIGVGLVDTKYKMHTTTRREAKTACDDAARDGDLTLRGGIER